MCLEDVEAAGRDPWRKWYGLRTTEPRDRRPGAPPPESYEYCELKSAPAVHFLVAPSKGRDFGSCYHLDDDERVIPFIDLPFGVLL